MEPVNKSSQEQGIQPNPPMLPVIIMYGGIGAVFLVLIMVLLRFGLNIDYTERSTSTLMAQIVTPFLNFVVYVVLMILAIIAYKKLNGGYISLGKGFGVTYLTGLFMAVINMIFSILLLYFFGFPGTGLGSTGDTLSGVPQSTSVLILMSSVLIGFIFGCLGGALVALIVSLVAKKEKPITFNVY